VIPRVCDLGALNPSAIAILAVQGTADAGVPHAWRHNARTQVGEQQVLASARVDVALTHDKALEWEGQVEESRGDIVGLRVLAQCNKLGTVCKCACNASNQVMAERAPQSTSQLTREKGTAPLAQSLCCTHLRTALIPSAEMTTLLCAAASRAPLEQLHELSGLSNV
jgi:hypothetical protein